MTHGNEWDGCSCILFAFHEGQFDKSLSKLPKIFGNLTYKAVVWPPGLERAVIVDTDILLIEDTEATSEELPHDILNTIISCKGILPQGVIKIELARYGTFTIESATIYSNSLC